MHARVAMSNLAHHARDPSIRGIQPETVLVELVEYAIFCHVFENVASVPDYSWKILAHRLEQPDVDSFTMPGNTCQSGTM